MSRITVLIATEDAIFRKGLGLLLAQAEDIQIVGEAADGLQAIAMTEAFFPDILLLNLKMPALGGIEALPKIREKSPGTKVLILSGFCDDGLTIQALQRGTKGYLSKSLTSTEFVKAIRVAHAGEIWAERKVLTEVLESLRQKVHGMNASFADTQEILTGREREIVKWTIRGMTNKEIAARIGISDKTIKTHMSNIFRKLRVGRRLQLALRRISTES